MCLSFSLPRAYLEGAAASAQAHVPCIYGEQSHAAEPSQSEAQLSIRHLPGHAYIYSK